MIAQLNLLTVNSVQLVYLTFANWSNAESATFHYLDATPIGSGYRAAPQVFFMSTQNLWYLVFQNGNAAYSTNTDITNPSGWSSPQNFFSSTPSIITQNIGSGYWVDMWTICDSSTCYLFSSDDNGHLYRFSTSVSNFPNGMGNGVIAISDVPNDLFEASNVYNVGGGIYLLIVECIGSTGHRYFRSWTSSSLSGSWTTLAATESHPFAGANNVAFPGGKWTSDISHGEAVRSNVDQTMSLGSACNIQYVYQGLPTGASGDYNTLPWKLALLTQTNCATSPTSTTKGGGEPVTTTVSASTATSSSGDGGSECSTALYGQCGGQGFTGCTTCTSGSTCKYSNICESPIHQSLRSM